MNVNDFILKCWEVDDTGWEFRVVSDLWWEVVAVSDNLGVLRAVSGYQTDEEATLITLLKDINSAKMNNK